MKGLDTFLAMGGYARFVWSAYGVALLVLVLNVAAPLVRRRRLLRDLRQAARLQQRRKK